MYKMVLSIKWERKRSDQRIFILDGKWAIIAIFHISLHLSPFRRWQISDDVLYLNKKSEENDSQENIIDIQCHMVAVANKWGKPLLNDWSTGGYYYIYVIQM